MTKHTEGPWHIGTMTETGLPGVMQAAGPIIAEITKWTSVGHSDPDVVQANARLIASAPDMYEAGRWVLHVVSGVGKSGGPPTDEETEAAFDSLKAAMAKARPLQKVEGE